MTQPLTLEIALEKGALLFRTGNMNDLRFLSIPDTVENFHVKPLSVGNTFTILPNKNGREGTYRVKDIRTYITSTPGHDAIAEVEDRYGINLTYIVEKV